MKYNFKYPPRSLSYAYFPQKALRSYYTIPFPSKYHDNQNVLAFYENPALVPEEYANQINKMPLQDVKYLANILKMPAVIVLASYCEIDNRQEVQDVYFINPNSAKHIKT